MSALLALAADLDDDALVAAFHRGTLSPEGFDHRQHVRLAWSCLRRCSLPRVLEGFRPGLERLAAHTGSPGLYHQTITWTYLLLVAERLACGVGDGDAGGAPGGDGDGEAAGDGAGWEAFAEAHPDLLARPSDLLGCYYRPETLASDRARRSFVFPELPAR